MILLDTHVLVWSVTDEADLGEQARAVIDSAWSSNEVAVSAITFWEVAMLQNKGRLDLQVDIGSWRKSLLNDGLLEVPVDGQIGIQSVELNDLHRDPADRLIVATALSGDHQLITVDREILAWPGPLDRLDARS